MTNETKKKRFGVSLEAGLAEDLDRLSGLLGVDRSKLVNEAVRLYLEDHRHMLIPHSCRGVIVALCPSNLGVAESVRDFKEIILGHMHLHLDGYCIDILIVSGESNVIGQLYGSLERKKCRVRFLPIGDKNRVIPR